MLSIMPGEDDHFQIARENCLVKEIMTEDEECHSEGDDEHVFSPLSRAKTLRAIEVVKRFAQSNDRLPSSLYLEVCTLQRCIQKEIISTQRQFTLDEIFGE